MRTAILTALALLPALHAFGQTTTVDVPQGSGPFPTVGQINCLEEVGGRYCSATWECGGEFARLGWLFGTETAALACPAR